MVERFPELLLTSGHCQLSQTRTQQSLNSTPVLPLPSHHVADLEGGRELLLYVCVCQCLLVCVL